MAEWISVKERLPGSHDTVLIAVGGTNGTAFIEVGYWSIACSCWRYDATGYEAKSVTHWMPLPKPPKEDV